MIQFHQKVKVISSDDYPEYLGMEGYVQGMGIEDDGKVTGYNVRFDDEEVESMTFEPHEIEGLDEFLTKEEFDQRFMTDVTLRVGVNQYGEGQVLPRTE